MSTLRRLTRALHPGRHHRRAWQGGRLAYLEVRGLDDVDVAADVARAVERSLASHGAVAWARALPPLGRVAIGLVDDDAVPADELVAMVEMAEADLGVLDRPFPLDRPDHPGDREPFRNELVALAADGAALGIAVAGRVGQLARLPVEVAAVVPLVQSQPWLRYRLEAVIGHGPSDVAFGLINAATSALSQGPLGLVTDAADRVLRLRELAGAARVWSERALELSGPDGREAHGVIDVPPGTARGPADTYADRAGLAAFAGAGATLLGTRLPGRASAVLLAGVPKAARVGPQAFAAHLHRILADRGIVCLDAQALRRLDRVDTVVLDARVLGTADAPAAGARQLVAAARAADHMVVIAGGDAELVEAFDAHLHVAGGAELVDGLRTLREDGCGTLVVSADEPAALALAECGVGLLDGDGRPPWGAHVVVTERGLADAILLVEAAAVAHEASRQSAALALGGSGIGAVLGTTAPTGAAARQSLAAVNMTSLVAMANGVRAAQGLAGPPVELVEDAPDWHALDADEVLAQLGTSGDGLGEAEAMRRLAGRPGVEDRRLGLARAFAEELANPLTPVLAVGATLSAAVGSPTDAGLVGGVVGLNALVAAAQRVRVDRAVVELQAATAELPTRVRRDGEVRDVPAAELVSGDVVVFAAGDTVPADCRILAADNLEVDESSLTGESLPVAKSAEPCDADAVADRTSMLYDGTAVAAGEAEAVVVAVGGATELGSAMSGEAVVSQGVERRLADLSRVTLPVAVAGGLVVTGAGLVRGQGLRRSLAPGVNLAVAAVPEGLPLLATVAQLSGAQRLAERGALARNPRAIETLGRVEVLCVDKTGTLTGGRIELGVVTDGVRERSPGDLDDAGVRIVAASVRASPEARPDEVVPHMTDRAVLEGAAEADIAADEEIDSWERRAELPFEPGRGYHAVLGRNGSAHNLLCVKGAPEVLLPRCDGWAHPDGDRPLTDDDRRHLEEAVAALARRGHRVLAVAEREASSRRDLEDDRVARLHLLGFLGLVDPVRPEATEGVARLMSAGLRVVMVTGDHPSTAEGIAEELGILGDGQVVTGVELDDLDDERFDAALPEVSVFARVTPAHKVRIVEAYRRQGRTVAMTGDGANDAPAIRLADVGVALGEQATAAARTAADLVVPDGRIETIVTAIAEGRALWGSVRDALAILLGGNLGEIAFTVAGTVAGGRPPLTPRQLLLVNLMTDVAPGLAVAVRPPRDVTPEALLREGPDTSLGAALNQAIAARAVATAAGAGAAWTAGRLTGRPRRADTIGLAALVGSQLGQTVVASRGDPLVAVAGLGSAAVLGAIVQTPGLSQFFGCTPLGPAGWGIALASSVGATALGSGLLPLFGRLFVPATA